jgi:Ca-activated chloride channel family protein
MISTRRAIRTSLLLALLPALLGIDVLQSRNRATEEGNARFKAGKAEEALADYDKAAAKLPNDPGVQFNRGAALYSLSRWDEAAEAFLRATEAKVPTRKASAFYNLGNSLYQAKKFKEAAAAFKKSLAYDPADPRAKWNLELALRKKADEEKNQDKNKDSKDDKGKEKDSKDKDDKQAQKDDKQDKDKGDQGKDKGDKPNSPKPNEPPQDKPPEQDKQAQQDPAKQDPSQPPAQGQKPPEKPPEKPPGGQGQAQQPPPKDGKPTGDSREIEAILDNLERSPKSLEQELARLRAAQRRPPAKDW